MKKLIYIFLALLSIGVNAQTANGTETPVNSIRLRSPQTVTSTTHMATVGTDGTVGKVLSEDISLTIIPPTINYTPLTPNLKGHFQGIDNALGDIVATTAGNTTRVWFTGDATTIGAGTFYLSNQTSKGTVASAIQSVTNDDNQKKYFTQDLIGQPFAQITTFPPGVYAGSLSASTSPNSAKQRFTVELYRCDNNGTPIASGVSGAPVGDLGVTVIIILDSGELNLSSGSIMNVPVSNNLTSAFTINTGERVRYHVSAEKVGTDASNIIESVYYGTAYNSYLDVPVPLNSSGVTNVSTVTGATVTVALDNLNIGKENATNKQNSLATDGTAIKFPTVDAVSGGTAYKRTIAQIRALSGTLPNTNFYTTDLGQEGNWYYDSTDITSADNTGTILVTADGKRIKRIHSGAVNVSWYGILPNLVTDFSSNVATILGLHNEIFFPSGSYNVTITSAMIFSNKIIRGVKPSWSGSSITGGSIINGAITVVGNDNIIQDLGIYNSSVNGITLRVNASRNIIENCIFNVVDHGVLIEQFGGGATNNIVRFCDSYGAVHGFVSKASNTTFLKCRAFSPSQDGFALVSDNITGLAFPSFCSNNSLIDCEVYNTNTGIRIYSRDYSSTNNASGILLRNIRIIGGNIDTCSAYGISIGDEATAPGGQTYNDVENISITGGMSVQNTVTRNITVARSNNVYIGGNNFRGIVERFNSIFAKNYKLGVNNNINFSIGNSVYNTINTVNATTIDASLVNDYLETNNTVTTVLSAMTNGKVGQIVRILINDDFTVIPKGSVFRLSKTYIRGKGSFVWLKLANDGSGWDEIFSDNVANFQFFNYASSMTVDYNFANNAESNLTGNVSSIVFSNIRVGVVIKLILQADAGTRNISGWDSRIIWLNGSAPTSVTAGNRLSMEFYWNGTNIINISRSDGTTDLLTGYVSGIGTISASDTVLSAIQKLNGNAATSGTYTPTLTNTTNVTGATIVTAIYTKIGGIVTVTIGLNASVTTASIDSQIDITLPITRISSSPLYAGSSSGWGTTSYYAGSVTVTNTTTAALQFRPNQTGTNSFAMTFSYKAD